MGWDGRVNFGVRLGGDVASYSGLMGVVGTGVEACSVGGELAGEMSVVVIGSSLTMGLTLTTVLMPCMLKGRELGSEKVEVWLLAPEGDEEVNNEAAVGMGRVTGEAVVSPLGSVLM